MTYVVVVLLRWYPDLDNNVISLLIAANGIATLRVIDSLWDLKEKIASVIKPTKNTV